MAGEKLRLWRLFILGRTAVTGVFLLALWTMHGLIPVSALRPLFFLACLQLATNAVYLYLWQRRDLQFLSYLCFSLEIILIALLIYFLGPDGYVFVLAYLWPVIMGGWLSGRRAVAVLTLLSALGCMAQMVLGQQGLALSDRILLPNGTPLAYALSLPYLLFISLLIWLLTGETKAHEQCIKSRNEELNDLNARLCLLFENSQYDRNLLREIVAHMAEGIVVVDGDQRVLLANRAASALLHVYEGQSLPGTFLDCTRALQRHSQDGYYSTEYDGKIIGISIAELPGTAQIPTSTIYVARDITQQTQIEQMKADFVAYASHELRTPLTTIKMLVRLLLMDTPGESKQHQYLSMIRTQLDRQVRLVNNLLDFTRLEAGKYDLAPEEVDPHQLIQTVLGVCRPLAEEKRQRLQATCPPAAEGLIANAGGLEQVLTNLLTNAIKFTPEEGNIHLTYCRGEEEAAFIVEDSGIGMTPEQLQRLFTKFYTARNPGKRHEGTGLGLAISDMIVRQLGGRIEVKSRANAGSTFSVHLPACQAQPALVPTNTLDGRVLLE